MLARLELSQSNDFLEYPSVLLCGCVNTSASVILKTKYLDCLLLLTQTPETQDGAGYVPHNVVPTKPQSPCGHRKS